MNSIGRSSIQIPAIISSLMDTWYEARSTSVGSGMWADSLVVVEADMELAA
jgi:hypothetical protein